MDTPIRRRSLLAGIGTGLCAGCLSDSAETGTPSAPESDGTATPVQNTEDDDTSTSGGDEDDSMKRFLEKNETPENAGAREFLATVEDETDGLMTFTDSDNTDRIGFSEAGDTWEIKYSGTPHAGEDRFREEIAELATTFASNRPDGVSLEATSLHECTTGTWHVSAATAAAYDRGELDRQKFVDRVYENAEIVNNC